MAQGGNVTDYSALKDHFYVAKLSLLNVRLLAAMEEKRPGTPDVGSLVREVLAGNGVSEPCSLMHQSTFLHHAYVCLVWLWEACKRSGLSEDDLAKAASGRLSTDFVKGVVVVENTYSTKPRIMDLPGILKTCRNAIAHARVHFEDHVDGFQFVFTDVKPSKPPKPPETATIRLSSNQVGQLSDAVLFALSDLCYPRKSIP